MVQLDEFYKFDTGIYIYPMYRHDGTIISIKHVVYSVGYEYIEVFSSEYEMVLRW